MNEIQPTVDNNKGISLAVEVAGCACTCNHCGNQGHPYPSMELEEIERILALGAEFCRVRQMKFSAIPLHDFMMHKQVSDIMDLFDSYGGNVWAPVATTPGPVLGQRNDYVELLSQLKIHGTTMIWFAFHGLDEVHDNAVGRQGAFVKSMIALERVKSVGLRCGAAIYITTDNLHQIEGLAHLCNSGKLDCYDFQLAVYSPHPRGRAYESIRPQLTQLTPYIEKIPACTSNEFWCNLEVYTEAFYVNSALTVENPNDEKWSFDKWYDPNWINLVCKNNLDLHTGEPGIYGPYHGNLRLGGAQEIFNKALQTGSLPLERVYFPEGDFPTLRDLARNWGNPEGQKVHMSTSGIRYLWLDLAIGGARE